MTATEVGRNKASGRNRCGVLIMIMLRRSIAQRILKNEHQEGWHPGAAHGSFALQR
jgi:hypothetical protein